MKEIRVFGFGSFHCKKDAVIKEENTEVRDMSGSVDNIKRHFIHLYTTTCLKSGRPVCYMDVYEIFSPLDEQRLRQATSKGIPNKTYLRYHQNHSMKEKDLSQRWLEYSTLAL
ncbi:hypothetical protein NQ318_016146 [Aromia moschata]|uniref:Uncharacterized protein n=1 Tax=Aromia moschata TaxID=1265417 RepID=A0AAV8XZ38_9CUCU|nr:hypothetical protein NQ318_016146 [Aromia moschata]